MNDTDKQLLVSLQKEKAVKFLAQAEDMIRLKYWDLAANRFYYACFHSVQALFIARGINAHTHAGIITQYSLHFVKTGIVGISRGSFLARLFQMRQKADYNCAYNITEEEVHDIVSLAHDFVENNLELAAASN